MRHHVNRRRAYSGRRHDLVSRAACGDRVLDERLAHPVATRHLACLERVGIDVSVRVAPPSADEQTFVDWTPGELSEAWGR